MGKDHDLIIIILHPRGMSPSGPKIVCIIFSHAQQQWSTDHQPIRKLLDVNTWMMIISQLSLNCSTQWLTHTPRWAVACYIFNIHKNIYIYIYVFIKQLFDDCSNMETTHRHRYTKIKCAITLLYCIDDDEADWILISLSSQNWIPKIWHPHRDNQQKSRG